jgi:DNA-binding response OmpR family regulator
MAIRNQVRGRAVEILQVEDSPGDAALLASVLKVSGFPNKLKVVRDGEEALAFLNRTGIHANAPRPDVILLDLKLPGKDGLTILGEIRRNHDFDRIPVVILTGSDSDLDMNWASRMKADHYVVKPLELDHFAPLVKLLREIWLKTFRIRRNP